MQLNDLHPAAGSKKAKRRVGRGQSSGFGKTAARGQKGQKARSGGGNRRICLLDSLMRHLLAGLVRPAPSHPIFRSS